MLAGRDESGDVGHVDHQQRAGTVRDRRHPLEIDDPRIGRGSRDDELGPYVRGLRLERVVVDPLVLPSNAVWVHFVHPSREVDRRAVRQVTAMREVHAEDPIARLEHREVGDHVGLRATVRLDVDVLGAREEGERTLLRELLGDVHELAAAVVALARQALRVLVGEPRALRLHHGAERVVLARDQLDLVVLPATLALHRGPQLGVDLGHARPPEPRGVGHGHGGSFHRRSSRSAGRGCPRYRPTTGPGSSVPGRRPHPLMSRTSQGGAPLNLSISDGSTAPARRMMARAPVQSTTVEGTPPRERPPSTIRSTCSPRTRATDSASRHSCSPDRFAEVVGSGPSALAIVRGVS